ncbi:hypothetical protein K435DRAFT_962559 [Dendrothele bispora CBS 962.96]|uniref:Zn(2)-C6 fungal-type domain-containing protein n=1 Tax=Dendrothele bispora (strain CBS 962.96) TaxID=1314807 RepID=A0A4S8MK72_DENBC|nr:hypothetical protein K435DRAFT_962559 [Dendrothele bispora CBS 962.96]
MLSHQSSQPVIAPASSLQTALQLPDEQPPGPVPPPTDLHHHMDATSHHQPPSNKRRKKNDGDDPPAPSEPRRLRRSHEACARCRGKKIKCDSKHPRCTACVTAGTPCQQEDRHRQTLTPRGHTERLELLIAQCEALLKRHYPGFSVEHLDEILAREGIDPTSVAPVAPGMSPAYQYTPPPPRPFRTDAASTAATPAPPPPPAPSMPYPPHLMPPPGYPHPGMIYGAPYPPMPGYVPPGFPPPPGAPYPPPLTGIPPHPEAHSEPHTRAPDIKGQDPKFNDMSNTQALAKSFGVAPSIVGDLGNGIADREDLAVGSSGLSSGRDRVIQTPRDTAKWHTVSVLRTAGMSESIDVWLPKDRNTVQRIVKVYFTRLNLHRPVFARNDFDRNLEDLYSERSVYDPGFICSLYLVMALGTLSDLNNRSAKVVPDTKDEGSPAPGSPIVAKKLLPPEWPEHDEFFERALSVKPDLKVTISSLQALILLHWYLYNERQQRTLWRLVGSLVRLSIELGLHHDPTTQVNPVTDQNTFTEEECQLRIRLWGIVLVHDRGTSLLLGRPLAIAPSDANTPRPSRPKNARSAEFSEHFELSHPIAEIQADIINSLYSPSRQSGDTIMRNATRIIKSMQEFRRGLPEEYKNYFGGTDDWTLERKSKLVEAITEDQGLTLLKIGISRILLLRALFSLKELSYSQRRRALVDAIVTSHNTIIVHSQLIRFPDIAFFTSPIPLHIAAMVILYGRMSKCDRLDRNTQLEDVWLALDMLPRFRWRWERKDANGGHPLIAKLAERVMEIRLQEIRPAAHPHLLSEPEWEEDSILSPSLPKSQTTTPTLSATSYTSAVPSPTIYGPHPRTFNSLHATTHGGTTPPDKSNSNMAEVPAGLFYPFYPEIPVSAGPGPTTNGHPPDYSMLLAAAAAPHSSDTYMSEDRDPGGIPTSPWGNVPHSTPPRPGMSYAIPPQT